MDLGVHGDDHAGAQLQNAEHERAVEDGLRVVQGVNQGLRQEIVAHLDALEHLVERGDEVAEEAAREDAEDERGDAALKQQVHKNVFEPRFGLTKCLTMSAAAIIRRP